MSCDYIETKTQPSTDAMHDAGGCDLRNRGISRGAVGRLRRQPTDRCRHPQHVRIARDGGIAAGEVGDALEPVPNRIWMNEQFASACLDRTSGLQISIE